VRAHSLAHQSLRGVSFATAEAFQDAFGAFTTLVDLPKPDLPEVDFRALDFLIRKDLGCVRGG